MSGADKSGAATRHFSPIMIGGPARNGKSLLATMIGAASDSYFNVPFELLLNVYVSGWGAWRRNVRRKILDEYVRHRRSISPDGSQTSSPENFIGHDQLAGVLDEASGQSSVAGGIACLLSRIAEQSGAKAWIGADYHAECDYRQLVSDIPGLRLIVAMRDPVEAVCASLYWRQFPQRHPDSEKELRFRISAWCLAAAAALRLRKTHPENVLVLDMNRLWSGDTKTVATLAAFLQCDADKLRAACMSRPWFSRTADERFFCPDGNKRELLSAAEIGEIDRATAPMRQALHQAGQDVENHSIPQPGVLSLMARMPRASRYLITLRHRPRERLAKSLSRIRRSIRHLSAA